MAGSTTTGSGIWLRLADTLLYRTLRATASILRALPSRWVLALADLLGGITFLLDRRGRRVGLQNLDVAFGDGKDADEKQRILRASYRQMLRSVLFLLHVSPMTRERYLRWVDVPPEVERRFRRTAAATGGAVLVSGHVGNWEVLLGVKSVHEGLPDLMFLAEALTYPSLDRFLADVRGSGGGMTAMRRGGARALNSHVRRGGAAALLVDRNVRGELGGIWAPFLGLPARTTPLPAWLARRNGVHLLPIFCLPKGDGRFRIWVGPNLAEGVGGDDEEADILELTTRVNQVIEALIRAEPELWNWTLKRFKSRPDKELGPYPAYSLWDP